MRRRYRRFILFCVVLGVLVGVASSGVLRQAPYYEPVARQELERPGSGTELPPEREHSVPERRRFLFFPIPWFTKVETVEPWVPEQEAKDPDAMLRNLAAQKLTFTEQLQVLRIAFTRLNSRERGELLKLMQGGITVSEALDTYNMLQERLTEEEMELTVRLMRKYQDDLLELLRK